MSCRPPVPSTVETTFQATRHDDLAAAEDRADLERGAFRRERRVAQVEDAAAVPALEPAATEVPRGAVELEWAEDRHRDDLVCRRIGRRHEAALQVIAVAAAATMPAPVPTMPSPMILFNIPRPPHGPGRRLGGAAYRVSRHLASASPRRRAAGARRCGDVGRTPRGSAGCRGRPVGQGETAVDRIDHRGRIDQLAHPRIGEVVEMLEDVDFRVATARWTFAVVPTGPPTLSGASVR